ncbi:hypothetical protein ACROSR_08810 [Roseovarius tibetensis]|uniref:hypothetical protein n=1 Tax=Roseovarius tibetensis TaxID=2685897 RepID=UPI003D7FE0D9
MVEAETIREFRNRVSNKLARKKYALKVEARNHAMLFINSVLDANNASVEEYSGYAVVDRSELVGLLQRDPRFFPSRSVLSSVIEASEAELSSNILHQYRLSLEFLDMVSRLEALETSSTTNRRKVKFEEFPLIAQYSKYKYLFQ